MKLLEALIQVRDKDIIIINQAGHKIKKRGGTIQILPRDEEEWKVFVMNSFLFDDTWEIYQEPKKSIYRVDMSWLAEFGSPNATMGMTAFKNFPAKNDTELLHWINALNTFFELKSHPLTGDLGGNVEQKYFLEGRPNNTVQIEDYSHHPSKISRISPPFETLEDAYEAIKSIGAGRLLHMFRTFQGIYE